MSDPNDKDSAPYVTDGENQPTDRPDPPHLDEFVAALGRVLDHAEPNGDVYTGAVADHALLRRAYFAAANFADGPASTVSDIAAGADTLTPP